MLNQWHSTGSQNNLPRNKSTRQFRGIKHEASWHPLASSAPIFMNCTLPEDCRWCTVLRSAAKIRKAYTYTPPPRSIRDPSWTWWMGQQILKDWLFWGFMDRRDKGDWWTVCLGSWLDHLRTKATRLAQASGEIKKLTASMEARFMQVNEEFQLQVFFV